MVSVVDVKGAGEESVRGAREYLSCAGIFGIVVTKTVVMDASFENKICSDTHLTYARPTEQTLATFRSICRRNVRALFESVDEIAVERGRGGAQSFKKTALELSSR